MIGENDLFPVMVKSKQRIENPRVNNLSENIKSELDSLSFKKQVKQGSRIAVTAGSRGISQIPTIIQNCLSYLKNLGVHPFIVPAMGSHGGATAKGQLDVLEHLGITEKTMGVPILSSMEVVEVGNTPDGDPVFMDRYAWESDGIVVINRIKPHTSMVEEIESGLVKMLSVGLGKEKGCSLIHARGLGKNIVSSAKEVLSTGKVIGGLAIIENSSEEVAHIIGLEPTELPEREKELFIKAKNLVPGLPFNDIDVLIVEEVGKNISGTGMDTKVVGRLMLPDIEDPVSPRIKIIVALDLTSETGGNANGIGLADIITRKLFNKIDFKATYRNVIATSNLSRGKLPVVLENDQEAISTALRLTGHKRVKDVKVVRIRNTLELKELFISESLLKNAREIPLDIISSPRPMLFDHDGSLK